MQTQTVKSPRAWQRAIAAIAALAVILTACSSSDPVDIESLGLGVDVDIEAGETFELSVPATPDVDLSLVMAPNGVAASLSENEESDMIDLVVTVDEDTARGDYALALLAVKEGDRYELSWPFRVIEPMSAAPTTMAPVDTTQPGTVEEMLVVDTPQPGDVFGDLSLISGRSSESFVGYRLLAGGQPIAQSSLETSNGEFEVKLGFINDCCIEMTLEVFHIHDDGLLVSIPLTYPESS